MHRNDTSRKVWWNGELIPETEARVSIYDSAFMFGDTIFEMTRSFNKIQFKLEEHIDRLYKSARYVHLDIPLSQQEIHDACLQTIAANEPSFAAGDEHRLMINITRGLLAPYHQIDIPSGPNVIIADFPLRWTTAGMGKLFDTGINMVIPSQRAIPASLLEPKVKNRSRLHYLMANIEVSRMKGDNNWALLLDPDGFITEGTGCNFFIVKKGKLITPEPRNILRGISRQFVMEFADMPVIEKNIEPYDVYDADEAFVTGTPFCLLPVVSLNGLLIGDGTVRPIFNCLLAEWSRFVDLDIKRQIQSWDNGAEIGTSVYSFRAN